MDAIEVEVCNKLFASVAEEMGIILARSSFSSNIKERKDFSCAIFDRHGNLVAQAAHIPVHLGAMPRTVAHALCCHTFAPGDILIIVNDPFRGGSHLPDITLMRGVHDPDGRPLFYIANRAHHADVGGKNPGSMGFSRHLGEEGVLIPPTMLVRQGTINDAFINGFLRQVRNPEERLGDLRAQQAALERGRLRLLDIVARRGEERLFVLLDQLQHYAEKLMRATIAGLPDGTYDQYVEHTGGGAGAQLSAAGGKICDQAGIGRARSLPGRRRHHSRLPFSCGRSRLAAYRPAQGGALWSAWRVPRQEGNKHHFPAGQKEKTSRPRYPAGKKGGPPDPPHAGRRRLGAGKRISRHAADG